MADQAEVIEEIEREIATRIAYPRFDFVFVFVFVFNHFLLFIVVLASNYPAFAQIFGDGQSKLTAGIAAIPAFVLLFQRIFRWEHRGEWHWDYRCRLQAILRQARDQGMSIEEASRKLNQLQEELAGNFPGVNCPTSRAER